MSQRVDAAPCSAFSVACSSSKFEFKKKELSKHCHVCEAVTPNMSLSAKLAFAVLRRLSCLASIEHLTKGEYARWIRNYPQSSRRLSYRVNCILRGQRSTDALSQYQLSGEWPTTSRYCLDQGAEREVYLDTNKIIKQFMLCSCLYSLSCLTCVCSLPLWGK